MNEKGYFRKLTDITMIIECINHIALTDYRNFKDQWGGKKGILNLSMNESDGPWKKWELKKTFFK